MAIQEDQNKKHKFPFLLSDIKKKKVVLLGIGNILKGDDGFGPALVHELEGKVPITCIDAGPAPENYAGKIIKEVFLKGNRHPVDLTPM